MTQNLIRRGTLFALPLLFSVVVAPVADAQTAPAPALKVGDRWVYNVKSGVGISPITYQETREVTAVSAGSAKIKITGKTANGTDFTRVDEYSAPGALRYGAPCADEAYRFPTPLQRVTFPLGPGQRSSKWVDVVAEPAGSKGQINYSLRARSWESLTVPAGTFDAIRVDTQMSLDDSTPFRYATECNFSYWYSPAVRGTVKEQRWAQYMQIGDIQGRMPVLHAFYELASFTPGK
jgi:hypothetical protein